MSDADFRETMRTKAARFAPSVALLGMDTNGAMPQVIHGLYIDAEISFPAARPWRTTG